MSNQKDPAKLPAILSVACLAIALSSGILSDVFHAFPRSSPFGTTTFEISLAGSILFYIATVWRM